VSRGAAERWGVWGAMSWPPTLLDTARAARRAASRSRAAARAAATLASASFRAAAIFCSAAACTAATSGFLTFIGGLLPSRGMVG